MVGLCDCNSFYVSCERLFRPDLRTRPVVVLSNNDGCIVSLSREAKEEGFSRGMSFFQIQDLVKKSGATVFSSNYTLYQDMSRRVMETLAAHVSHYEINSIDEAFFLPEPPRTSTLEHWASDLRHTILEQTGIPVSIGIGRTKTLAKIAGDLGKAHDGSYVLRQDEESSVLRNSPVQRVWGVGWRSAEKLKNAGIHTASDILAKSEDWMKRHFTVTGLDMHRELRGIPSRLQDRRLHANFCSGISFSRPSSDRNDIHASLASHCMELGRKLTSAGTLAGTVSVEIFSDRFQESYIHSFSTAILPYPTAYASALMRAAGTILDKIWQDDVLYKGSRVWTGSLVPATGRQHELFTPDEENHRRDNEDVMAGIISEIARLHGPRTLMSAAARRQVRIDLTKREFLSPAYTTRWRDLPHVT